VLSPPAWIYTQVGHKLRFSLVLINDSCVVQVRNSTLLRTLHALLSLINPYQKIVIYAPLEYNRSTNIPVCDSESSGGQMKNHRQEGRSWTCPYDDMTLLRIAASSINNKVVKLFYIIKVKFINSIYNLFLLFISR